MVEYLIHINSHRILEAHGLKRCVFHSSFSPSLSYTNRS